MINKQTPVEWLVNIIEKNHDKKFSSFYNSEIEQAKAMEADREAKYQKVLKECYDFINRGANTFSNNERITLEDKLKQLIKEAEDGE